MPRAIFISPDGASAEVDVAVGTSLMQAATVNGIEGIVGDCGGAMSCATCHVFVEEQYLSLLDEPSPAEAQMLDYTAAPRQPNSRLSCQLLMTEERDGLTVRIADPQL
ncbi:MAG: 2Fe-2S iron-sulfur cluster-binding protein [Pseudomonadota bacterium]|jgi:2Fe-2S ferredoxin